MSTKFVTEMIRSLPYEHKIPLIIDLVRGEKISDALRTLTILQAGLAVDMASALIITQAEDGETTSVEDALKTSDVFMREVYSKVKETLNEPFISERVATLVKRYNEKQEQEAV